MQKSGMISSSQMVFLFFIFMTGSSIVNVPGPVITMAQNGAWISLLCTLFIGGIFLAVLFVLHRLRHDFTLVEFSYHSLGKILTVFVVVPVIIYLLIMVTWIVMGVGGFMSSSTMRDTPEYVFHFFIFLTVALTVRAGIEVMARMFVMFTILVVFFVVIVLVLSMGYYDVDNLFPIMPDGIKPILHGGYFTLGFPYSEVLVFAMLLPFTRLTEKHHLYRKMYFALGLNGLILIVTTVCSIMAFGPISGELRYPIFAVSRLIDFADFLQRIESMVGLSLITSSYMKATIVMFALNQTIVRLCKIKDEKILVFPLTLVCFFLSNTMYDSQAAYGEAVNSIWTLLNIFFLILPCFVVTIASLLRLRLMKQKSP